jgi:hypothetical protein
MKPELVAGSDFRLGEIGKLIFEIELIAADGESYPGVVG